MQEHLDGLGSVLADCVQGGASVSFMLPYTAAEAARFYEGLLEEVRAGRRIVLAAFLDGQVAGTVQVVFASAPNQPHRADIAKLLVRRSARRAGLARALMLAAEQAARDAGRWLLVLDTAAHAAEQLYLSMGWVKLGTIPEYALLPEGRLCDTTVFWEKAALLRSAKSANLTCRSYPSCQLRPVRHS